MSDANLNIVRDFLEGAWNRKDISVADKYIAANHVSHDPMEGQFPQGLEGQKLFIKTFLSAFPDVKATINEQYADGDTVESHVTYRGTQTGELMGIPATGKKAVVDVKIKDRIAGGKIVESWVEWDPQDMMRQLGVE